MASAIRGSAEKKGCNAAHWHRNCWVCVFARVWAWLANGWNGSGCRSGERIDDGLKFEIFWECKWTCHTTAWYQGLGIIWDQGWMSSNKPNHGALIAVANPSQATCLNACQATNGVWVYDVNKNNVHEIRKCSALGCKMIKMVVQVCIQHYLHVKGRSPPCPTLPVAPHQLLRRGTGKFSCETLVLEGPPINMEFWTGACGDEKR